MIKKNAPYVKILKDGILQNPITKENPFLNSPNIYFLKMQGKLRRWVTTLNSFFIGKTATN